MAKDELFCNTCGIRANVPKVLIVLTDGESSSDSESLSAATQPLKVFQSVFYRPDYQSL